MAAAAAASCGEAAAAAPSASSRATLTSACRAAASAMRSRSNPNTAMSMPGGRRNARNLFLSDWLPRLEPRRVAAPTLHCRSSPNPDTLKPAGTRRRAALLHANLRPKRRMAETQLLLRATATEARLLPSASTDHSQLPVLGLLTSITSANTHRRTTGCHTWWAPSHKTVRAVITAVAHWTEHSGLED